MNGSETQSQNQRSPKSGAGLYQCSTCQRTYTRVDHLARHVRSHVQERPFECQTCKKTFGRPDLLKRHAACHDGDKPGSKRVKRHHNQAPRVSQACRACATAKLKCDDQKPCARCQQRGITCEFAEDSCFAKTAKGLSNVLEQENPTSPQDSQLDERIEDEIQVQEESQLVAEVPNMLSPSATSYNQLSPPRALTPAVHLLNFPDHEFSGFLRGVMTPSFRHSMPAPDWLGFDDMGPQGLLDFTIDDCLDLNNTDLGFLDQLCGNASAVDQQLLTTEKPEMPGPPANRKHVALGVEAFRKSSLGTWLPSHQDHGDADLENLSMIGTEGGSPDSRLKLSQHCLGDSLSRTVRDDLLAMILSTCKPERASFVIRAFPQAELLGDLTQNFFSHHSRRADSFIHVPSFRLNEQKPELLGAVAAAGALLTDISCFHKVGFVIQDAVRAMLPIRCEEANALTRQLWILQTFMSMMESGMWSGVKRKMEIAESQPQVLYTMLRRAGRFHRLKQISLFPEDAGETLHRKWLQWIELESFKRLIFHAFIFDAQVCMAMLTNPIISYAELEIPLPESRDLWMAEDAEQWKAIYFSQNNSRDQHVSLSQFLQQPTELSEHHDVHFSSLIILHGIWGMIWQHLELLSAFKGQGHSLPFIALRHQDLLQAIQNFKINILGCQQMPSQETRMMIELMPMYLHMSLKETQLFAGKGDIEDARRVLPHLQQWVDTSHARQAIWHAGQVLRMGKEFPPKALRDFYAIGVYHAGLTLWTYGVVSHMKTSIKNTSTSTSNNLVFLDRSDSPAVQQFITLGKGTPGVSCYHTSETPSTMMDMAPLSNLEAVMGILVAILRNNFAHIQEGESVPPLVENLAQLLQDLGTAAGNVGS